MLATYYKVEKAFEQIKEDVKSLLGGAEVFIFNSHERPGDSPRHGSYSLTKQIRIDGELYKFLAVRNELQFTKTERTICIELLNAFQVLLSGFTNEGYPAHLRTALMVSLLDISVARYLRANRYGAFWSIQRLIQILKKLSFERYEGSTATSEFVIYRTKTRPFVAFLKSSTKHYWMQLEPTQKIAPLFFGNPLTYRLIDGHISTFAGNIKMQIRGIIRFDQSERMDAVDRLTYRNVMKLLQNAGGPGSFAIFVNQRSEIEAITDEDKFIIWRRGAWRIFDKELFHNFLSDVFENSVIDDLLWTIYSLSKVRHGTVVLVSNIKYDDLQCLKKGSVAGNDISKFLVDKAKGKSINELKRSGELMRILSSDGLTIINQKGEVVDTGFIIDISKSTNLIVGGGRTTAASVASNYGKVIKVSEDGPIEFFVGGKCIYKFG